MYRNAGRFVNECDLDDWLKVEYVLHRRVCGSAVCLSGSMMFTTVSVISSSKNYLYVAD